MVNRKLAHSSEPEMAATKVRHGTVTKEGIRGCRNVTNVALYRIGVKGGHARLLFRLPERLQCGYYPSTLNANAFAVLLCDACAKKFDLADLI